MFATGNSRKLVVLFSACSLMGSLAAQSFEAALTSNSASICPDSTPAVQVGENDGWYSEIYRGPEMRYRSPYASASAANGTYADLTVPLRLQWVLQRLQSDLFDHLERPDNASREPDLGHRDRASTRSVQSPPCEHDERQVVVESVIWPSERRKSVKLEFMHRRHQRGIYDTVVLDKRDTHIKELRELSEEMNANEPLRKFSCIACNSRSNDSACQDLNEWNWTFNTSLGRNNENFSQSSTWRDSPTIFVESYFYRRLNHIFQKLQSLRDWDFFEARKAVLLEGKDAVISDMFGVLRRGLEKAARLNGTFVQAAALSRAQLRDLLQLSIWAEKQDNDLGKQGLVNRRIPLNRNTSASDRLDFDKEKERLKTTLLLDKSEEIWNSLITAKNLSAVKVDVICGGYGLELISDLILGEYLVSSTLAHRVHFHVKSVPWFETDATNSDFRNILDVIGTVEPEYGDRFKKRLADGSFVVSAEMYWTLPFQYDWMLFKDPALHRELKGSDLLVFKGDLNYRKLVGWQTYTGSLTSSLLTLFSDNKVNIAMLRTIKSDPVGGLSVGQEEALFSQDPDWRLNGKYALIDFEPKYEFE